MPISRYLKAYPSKVHPDKLFLFSTKKASKVLIPKNVYHDMENGTLSPENEKLLTKLGMIVPDLEEEKQLVINAVKKRNENSEKFSITVVLNMDCNLACVYCIEEGIKGRFYMQEDTAELLVQFIKNNFKKRHKKLLIDFYGGEPLLSFKLIESISSELKAFVHTKGAEFQFTLVTNGTLFSRKVAEILVPLGLVSIKVTLDGPKEIHDQYRPFISGKGSFDRIIENIKNTCDLVKINIGGNYDINSYKSFVGLLDYFQDTGLKPEKLNFVKFDPIINKPAGDISPADYHDGCMSTDEAWLKDADQLLRGEIIKRGYKTSKPAPILCMVEEKDAYVVNYDGHLYKCPAFIGKKEYSVGTLQTGIEKYDDMYNIGMYKNEKCENCVYLPLCFGGCRYMSFIKHGNVENLDCRKKYYDEALEGQVSN